MLIVQVDQHARLSHRR